MSSSSTTNPLKHIKFVRLRLETSTSMKPLETSQQVLIWLSGLKAQNTDGKRIVYIIFTIGAITASIIATVISIVFIYRNMSTQLEETLFCLFHTFGSSNTLYQLIVTVLLRHKLTGIFKNLSNIYNECNKKIEISFKNVFNETFF